MSERQPAVIGEETTYAGRFVTYRNLRWTDIHGIEHKWESAERTMDVGAVLIMARLMPSDRFILIRQFRPPTRRMVVEFPAGLMEPGEAPEISAARELREETGYNAKTLTVGPLAYTTPGMSNDNVYMVFAEIDETAPENVTPRTDFDSTENIETILVARADLPAFYRTETEKGHTFDAKLAGFISALQLPIP